MSTKQAVLEMIQKMPDDMSLPDIIAELYVRQKIEQGLRELDSGQGSPQEDVEKRLELWLK